MSQHEIEGLIEASIRAVDASVLDAAQKRNALTNLYRVQAGFDCSYTHFRCIDILLRYRATYRIPLSAHPDFASAPDRVQAPAGDWLAADVLHPEAGAVFYQRDDDHLYFDAGEGFWRRLRAAGTIDDAEPEGWSDAATVGCMLELAATAGDASLFSEWLGFAINALLVDDGAAFSAWLDDPEMRTIRVILNRNPALIRPRRGYRETRLEPLKRLLGYRQKHELDARYKLRFLLDVATDPEQLLRCYERDRDALRSAADRAETIIGIIRGTLAGQGWQCLETIQSEHNLDLLFIPAAQEDYPLADLTVILPVLLVNVSLEFNSVSASLGLKYALMMKWHGADSWLALAQLKTDVGSPELSGMLSDGERSGNKHLHKTYAGWKLKPESQIGAHVRDLAEHIPARLETFLQQHSSAWFVEHLNSDPCLSEADRKFRKLPGKFLIRWHLVLLHAFALYEQGRTDEAKAWARRFLDYIAEVPCFDFEPYIRSARSLLEDAPLLQPLY